jgi:hypothetical protein
MISVEEFVERLCLVGAHQGPRGFPRKRKDRQIIMKSFVMGMDSVRTYTESQVNEMIQDWNRDVAPAIDTDHVTVRRWLVDYGLLERSRDGSTYRVGFPAASVVFDLEVEDIDVRATVAAYVDQQNRRTRPPEPTT